MNICLFTSTFLPTTGGVEYVIHYLAKNLVETGHHVTVLVKGRRRSEDAAFPYIVHRYRGVKGLISDEKLRAMHLIFEKLRTRFDVLHAHDIFLAGYVAVKLRNLLNVPVIVTPHGADIQKMPEISYGLRLRPEMEAKAKYTLQKADAITAISKTMKNEILDLISTEAKIYDVPNGVELNNFTRQNANDGIVRKFNLHSKDKIILAVGRNHIKKGFVYLVKAMSQVLKKHENTTLVIVGKDTESLVPLINELGLDGKVVLTGIVHNQDIPSFYRRADIFAIPSLIESFGVVIVEAMAHGLPIVGTEAPGVRDIIEDSGNGFLVPAKSPECLSEKIMYLLENDKLRKQMGEKSRQMAKQYDWKLITRKYVEVYKKVLDKQEIG